MAQGRPGRPGVAQGGLDGTTVPLRGIYLGDPLPRVTPLRKSQKPLYVIGRVSLLLGLGWPGVARVAQVVRNGRGWPREARGGPGWSGVALTVRLYR